MILSILRVYMLFINNLILMMKVFRDLYENKISKQNFSQTPLSPRPTERFLYSHMNFFQETQINTNSTSYNIDLAIDFAVA